MLRQIRDRFHEQEDDVRDETYKNVLDLIYFMDKRQCGLRFIHVGKQESVILYNIETIRSERKICVDTDVFAKVMTLRFTFKPKKTVRVQGEIVTIK